MLIYDDSSSLGDKKLNEVEGTARIKEDTLSKREKFKHPQHDILINHEMAEGNSMEPAEFIRRLQALDPSIIVEAGGIPNACAVRVICWDDNPNSDEYGKFIRKYVSGFYTDRKLPEFSSLIVEDDFTPRREVRGWRTVLLQLINQKVVTYKQVKTAFGDPSGKRNSLWMSQTKELRV